MLKSAPYFWVVTYLKLTLSGLKLRNWGVECKNTGSYNWHSPCLWLALNWGGEKEGKWREDWGDKKSSRLFSFCAFPSLSFPFLLYQACKLFPLSLLPLRFSPPLPPFYLCLHLLVLKDGHEMLWTGCQKVIALSPTLTYMYIAVK